ncbi:hypothetical protein [Pseudocitrobacter cyperus]|uniref:2-(5''-triphosphoribosyl)-3'-dephosphocoenzyme-A synthase n=1 Tax=Pseudocitrobacter cyperus TaxID=3112843 RepID=A0ABV0HIX5_9ENTR
MSQIAALRPAIGASSMEAVLNSVKESTDELEQLQPVLNLLAHPALTLRTHEMFRSCYSVGAQNAHSDNTFIAEKLPSTLRQSAVSLQSIGLLCAAAGKMNTLRKPMAHNRLCDYAGQFAVDSVPESAQIKDSFLTVRSIALPVYQRLLRDGHSHPNCVHQVLLHLLAWKSESQWVRQQAQRVLWQGGILGENGTEELELLDSEMAVRQFAWPSLWSLLAIAGFLVRYPAGPMFID